MTQHDQRNCGPSLKRVRNAVLLGLGCAVSFVGSASAAVVRSTTAVDFSGGSVSFGFDGTDIVFAPNSDFTFSDNKSVFPSPVDITTSARSQVTAFGGFLGIPLQPSFYYDPVRGFSPSLEFGPNTFGQLASFTTRTTIDGSAIGFYIELVETLTDGTHYGYARVAGGDSILRDVAFESVAGRSIMTPVPLPSSAPVFGAALVALGAAGCAAKRRKAASVT